MEMDVMALCVNDVMHRIECISCRDQLTQLVLLMAGTTIKLSTNSNITTKLSQTKSKPILANLPDDRKHGIFSAQNF